MGFYLSLDTFYSSSRHFLDDECLRKHFTMDLQGTCQSITPYRLKSETALWTVGFGWYNILSNMAHKILNCQEFTFLIGTKPLSFDWTCAHAKKNNLAYEPNLSKFQPLYTSVQLHTRIMEFTKMILANPPTFFRHDLFHVSLTCLSFLFGNPKSCA